MTFLVGCGNLTLSPTVRMCVCMYIVYRHIDVQYTEPLSSGQSGS